MVARRVIIGYEPRGENRSPIWPKIRGEVRKNALRYVEESDYIESSVRQTEASFKCKTSTMVMSLWSLYRTACEQGRGTDVADVFKAEFIEAWASSLEIDRHQQLVRRKAAVRVGEVVNPNWDRSKTVVVNYQRTNDFSFYTTEEIESARLEAAGIPSDVMSQRLLAGMGLSAGAGLTLSEMLRLTVGDISGQSGALLVNVTGQSIRRNGALLGRTVPLAAAWSPYVECLTFGRHPSEQLLVPGKSIEHRGHLMEPSAIVRDYPWSGLLPEYRLLRTTWIASLILAELPDNWILYLAGWGSSYNRLVRLRRELDGARGREVHELTRFMARRVGDLEVGVDLG